MTNNLRYPINPDLGIAEHTGLNVITNVRDFESQNHNIAEHSIAADVSGYDSIFPFPGAVFDPF